MKRLLVIESLSGLAQESRLDIFRLLVQRGPEGLAAGLIGERLDLPLPTLSFHLAQLKHAGLVNARREGRSIIYSANYKMMNDLYRVPDGKLLRRTDGALCFRPRQGGRYIRARAATSCRPRAKQEGIVMKRFHVHVHVADLDASVRFYSTLFGEQPTVIKSDYAKWILEDPRVNFAITSGAVTPRIDHLGFQVQSDEELGTITQRLDAAGQMVVKQENAACCYALGNKGWVTIPAAFHGRPSTLSENTRCTEAMSLLV